MRQYDEDMIDFPVSDCWRDHYAAQGLTYPAGRYERPPEPERPRGYSDSREDQAAWSKVSELLDALNRKQAEIERLKSQWHPPSDSRDSFEGVE